MVLAEAEISRDKDGDTILCFTNGFMSQSTSPLTYSLGFRTDVGLQRSLNEDAGAVFDLPGTAAAFVVCDGMGGLQAGDAASKEAVRVVQAVLTEHFVSGPPADVEAALRDAFSRANEAVNNLHTPASRAAVVTAAEAEEAPTVRRGGSGITNALMGTTCVAGVVVGDELTLAHAGDSRAYLWRGGRLTALTQDHSYVGERVRAGDITEAEARVSKFRNMITRAIGIDAVVDPEVRRETLSHGDTVLVCSDGLTTMLEDPEIAQMLRAPAQQRASPEKVASAFVEAANKKGGHDNTTVLILRARREGSEAPPTANDPMESIAPSGVAAARGNAGGISPTVVVVLCALLALAAIAAGVFFMQLRQERSKSHEMPAPSGVSSSPLTVDYARLVYDAPQLYTNFLARGDILSYSQNGGLYMIGGSSGTLVALDRSGKPGRAVANVEVVGAQAEVPSTRLFVATDPQGNTYIVHTKNRLLEKHGPDGRLLQTLHGFERPEAVAVNENGDLFVIDYNQVKVLRAHLPQASPSPPSATPRPAPSAVKPAAAGKK